MFSNLTSYSHLHVAYVRHPRLTTLDPQRLTPACYTDLSGKGSFCIHTPNQTGKKSKPISMGRKLPLEPAGPAIFPPNTAGFLYYHPPPAGAPDIAGQIRFRVTNSRSPESFHKGDDLLHRGIPWRIPLVPFNPRSEAFFPLLLADKFITEDQFHRCRKVASSRQLQSGTAVYALGQPFTITLLTRQTANESRFSCFSLLVEEDGEARIEGARLKSSRGVGWGYGLGKPKRRPKRFTAPGRSLIRCTSLHPVPQAVS